MFTGKWKQQQQKIHLKVDIGHDTFKAQSPSPLLEFVAAVIRVADTTGSAFLNSEKTCKNLIL